jgi:heat shock protein HslJ
MRIVLAALLVASCAAREAAVLDVPAAVAVQPIAVAALQGTRWRGTLEPGVDQRYAPWLEFVTEGRVSGFTGCNLLHGAWKIEGGTLRMGPLVTTKRACAGPEQQVERRVMAALGESAHASLEGPKLVFAAPGGERVEFVQVL